MTKWHCERPVFKRFGSSVTTIISLIFRTYLPLLVQSSMGSTNQHNTTISFPIWSFTWLDAYLLQCHCVGKLHCTPYVDTHSNSLINNKLLECLPTGRDTRRHSRHHLITTCCKRRLTTLATSFILVIKQLYA